MPRQTRQRTAVVSALEGLDDFRSAQQIHDLLRRGGVEIGLATVYRTLGMLAAEDVVDTLRTPDGETVYRRCGRSDHHHHLVCRLCGRAVEIEGPGVESWASRVAAQQGFSDVQHTLELTGVCAGCRVEGGVRG
ncbi:MAG TPA: transcriptional repressor [Propionibacteriaceae bacterium]|nr:transcriptional repressor [Propionibacteriaceae bacterium]